MTLNVTVIGLGNILLTDEGVGVHVVREMQDRFTFSPAVELLDGGTLGLDLLPYFEGRDRILIIDAVDFGEAPGHIAVIEDDLIPSALQTKMSVHHIGLSDMLCAAKLMGIMPEKVTLIGIQPECLHVCLTMSDCIESRKEALIKLAVERLKEWNITCASRFPHALSA